MPIVVTGVSHRTAPVEVRERFAFAEADISPALARLRENGWADEAVVLSTCNRVELYASIPRLDAPALRELRRFLCRSGAAPEPPEGAIYQHLEPTSVEHLFRVACGLDSMVLGETEILGQLKHAYDLALRNHHTGARLNKAFQRAFNVAKLIRTETQIQRGSVSVANVAVDLAEKIFSSLQGRHVMVIGAGDTGEKTAKALLSRGAARLTVTNRTFAHAETLAAALGGQAVPFEAWEQVFGSLDIVISSTAAPHHILDRQRLRPLLDQRDHTPLLLIDIAVPRDIEPEVTQLENVYLYNIDDLQAIANECLQQRKLEVARCEAIIREKSRGLLTAPTGPPPAPEGVVRPSHS